MSKLVSCPNCLGVGEEVIKRRVRPCVICQGDGMVDQEISEAFISQQGFQEY